jgi:hypothetical protein
VGIPLVRCGRGLALILVSLWPLARLLIGLLVGLLAPHARLGFRLPLALLLLALLLFTLLLRRVLVVLLVHHRASSTYAGGGRYGCRCRVNDPSRTAVASLVRQILA